jgi:aryl-alcohol dehydrogenase-like predicted oxidoreductase
MESKTLGNTGINVTSLCFGTLTMSPMQRGLAVEEGAEIILHGLESGVNFVDTAQMYGSYAQVKRALEKWSGARPVVSSKSAAKSKSEMEKAIAECLEQTGLDYIDVFLLHAVRDKDDFEARKEALAVLIEAKKAGRIRSIGASSHSAKTIQYLVEKPEIEVLHPMLNMEGIGILDASLEEMSEFLRLAKKSGKGIYAMKPLGGGHLKGNAATALKWIFDSGLVDSVAVGMTTFEEVDMNIAVAQGKEIDPEFAERVCGQPRHLFINEMICENCGNCIKSCQQGAIIPGEKTPDVDHVKCVLCGYCAPECPKFAIRII